jgi:hypothetical protein
MNALSRFAGSGAGAALALLLASPSLAADAAGPPLPTGVRTLPPERLVNYWLLDPDSAQANVPNSGSGLDAPTCVAVSYMIEKNGTTSHVKLERVVPQGPLGKVAFNVVKGMRFAPTAQNAGKEPIYTYVVIPFNLPVAGSRKPADLAQRKQVLDACNLPDFAPGR